MKTRTKIILAIPIALISVLVFYGEISYHLRQQKTAAIERKTFPEQRVIYAAFLAPGMTRTQVEEELHKRSLTPTMISGKGPFPGDEFVLLKRIGSPAWFCSFEDISIRLEFKPGNGPSEEDRLTGFSEHRQLMDCL